jgi:hypothetical protein
MKKHEIETDDLYEKIEDELDYLGGILSVVECLAAGKYEGDDNCMETLLANNRNGFMTIINDATQRFERARQMIREMQDRIPDGPVAV